MSRAWQWIGLCLVLLTTGTVAMETTYFEVIVPTSEPIGLRLSDKLEILEFLADSEGRSRVIEASGAAEIGDQLVAVNNVSLIQLSFQAALSGLQHASLPKILRFRTHDGRYLMQTVTDASEDAVDVPATYDYVLLSVGEKDSEETFYAVLSADGKPPSCLFREIVVADPLDACLQLIINATDRYVLVTSILGCPAHQKAAMAQEAGAKGVIFIQRVGEKPQQIRIPQAELPKPIQLPLVMVSSDSGLRMLQRITEVPYMDNLQLRLVFSEECASEKYTIHPDDDPLQRSALSRLEAATAGFLSLTVAASGSNTLSTGSVEFLKPTPLEPQSAPSASLVLGKHPLFLAPSRLNPCEMRAAYQAADLVLWAGEMENAFIATVFREKDCGLMQQVDFFERQNALGVIFVDESFPDATSKETVRTAAQQASIPFVFISSAALQVMRQFADDALAVHILVEFAGENALEHQWRDLGALSDVSEWPRTARARERLFYRMLKDQATVREHEQELSLAQNERHDALHALFEQANQHYTQEVEV
ncbi:hypothetical protein Poli38472_005596 [Pythium oligandrum]|uniref:PA domain-containing protein n=1 Tax=Pythium oligandrum TaxID=41045 RepID=A0A8K1CIA0_PYTOL|nr:hypothetical protein Poli38472_005596 [Pythium oligandrum]|eukprot:TMW62978.1 hypothetical protein Poli38472_005596 [Pythium oligandrum]